MIARPIDIDAPADDAPMFARAVLNMAAEVEAAETAIKDAIVAAATAGDTARVIDIVQRWNSLPAVEVLSKGSPGSVETP